MSSFIWSYLFLMLSVWRKWQSHMSRAQRTAKSSPWMLCASLRALLSALLQLARIQTDSVVEMLCDLYPDLRFEIGKFVLELPWARWQQEPAPYLCVQEMCGVLSKGGGLDPAYLRVNSVRLCG